MIQLAHPLAQHDFVAKRDSLTRVASARLWAEAADRGVRQAVAESHSMGIPWSQIADALDMTEHLARARYGS